MGKLAPDSQFVGTDIGDCVSAPIRCQRRSNRPRSRRMKYIFFIWQARVVCLQSRCHPHTLTSPQSQASCSGGTPGCARLDQFVSWRLGRVGDGRAAIGQRTRIYIDIDGSWRKVHASSGITKSSCPHDPPPMQIANLRRAGDAVECWPTDWRYPCLPLPPENCPSCSPWLL